jgi:hypothetical protein
VRPGEEFMNRLRELDNDTLTIVAGILVRRERAATQAGRHLEAACHSLGALQAQIVMDERDLGWHPEIRDWLNDQPAQN